MTDHKYLAYAFMIVVQRFVFIGCVLLTLVTFIAGKELRLLSIKLDSVISAYREYEFGFRHL